MRTSARDPGQHDAHHGGLPPLTPPGLPPDWQAAFGVGRLIAVAL